MSNHWRARAVLHYTVLALLTVAGAAAGWFLPWYSLVGLSAVCFAILLLIAMAIQTRRVGDQVITVASYAQNMFGLGLVFAIAAQWVTFFIALGLKP